MTTSDDVDRAWQEARLALLKAITKAANDAGSLGGSPANELAVAFAAITSPGAAARPVAGNRRPRRDTG